jgi:hypothetical protein
VPGDDHVLVSSLAARQGENYDDTINVLYCKQYYCNSLFCPERVRLHSRNDDIYYVYP